MPNCDWGRPCACSECRREIRDELCPRCGFTNAVELDCSAEFFIGRKDIPEYRMTPPVGPPMDLECNKCGSSLVGVEFFTSVAKSVNEARLRRERRETEAQPCSRCKQKSRDVYGEIEEQTNFKGQNVCPSCHIALIQEETPDPSTSTTKYAFNPRKRAWEISKVRRLCTQCGASRWLLPTNAWRPLCGSCFRNSAEAPVRLR